MASRPGAAELTEAHRLGQTRIGARTIRDLQAIWPLLDLTDLDTTVSRWLRAAVPLVKARRQESAQLSAAYFERFRRTEAPQHRPIPVALAGPLPAEQAVTSLTVTGPATVKAATARGLPLAAAGDLGLATSSRSAMRLALDGGRQTITGTISADPNALGWARATSGDPCAFCAMLASRGPTYSEEAVAFEAHDGCNCTAEPVYTTEADWPAGARQYRDLWDQATAGEADQLNAFRRALNA